MASSVPKPTVPEPEISSEPWEFAGWGTAKRITRLPSIGPTPVEVHSKKLGTWSATAICGNDITSSCLYVSALCTAQAGKFAFISLLVVAIVLFLFRKVYAEVGSALPMNGGTYTVLLNTTSKRWAATAACLTILSYVATAVISAGEAMHYAHNLWSGLDVMWATVVLLGLFAVVTIVGIGESAAVALAIFMFHLLSLTVLSIAAFIALVRDPSLLAANWSLPATTDLGRALFFGFAAAMLGISGFESSANFIEEQGPGVFAKTLRNMWAAVTVFNPLVAFLALGVLPLAVIQQAPADLLARMGGEAWGPVLRIWICVDAVLVLAGAVLASYVGVTGLIRRMSLDRCLPQFLLIKNRARGTEHWIVIAFFLVCCSILFVTRGKVATLAGVYTLSFLGVMGLFAVGNMLLKVKRASLPRETRASWGTVVLALAAVMVGIVGNVLLDPASVGIFMVYLVGAVVVVGLMFLRIDLLKVALAVIRATMDALERTSSRLRHGIAARINELHGRSVLFFASDDDPSALNRAALYVLRNEQTTNLKVVFLYDHERDIPANLGRNLSFIDRLYPELRIDFLAVKGQFGPDMVHRLSMTLNIPKNLMFIGTPGDAFPHRLPELGGVRLIM